MKEIECPNCGASFEAKEPRCPYCGHINPAGAEAKFLRDLEGTRKNLDQVDDEARAAYGSEMKRGARTAGKGGDRLFRLIIVLLAVILVIMAAATAYRINQSFSNYTSDPNDLLRSIKNGYYSDAVHDMHDNIVLGETAEKNPDYAVPYALLDYFEAESVYTGYVRAAELEEDSAKAAELMAKAEVFRADMEAARAGMGELAFMAEDIDGYFS